VARITDKERLDWLTAHGIRTEIEMDGGWATTYVHKERVPVQHASSLRKSIDAAIRAERKPKEAGR
jgi:hypothetical protein